SAVRRMSSCCPPHLEPALISGLVRSYHPPSVTERNRRGTRRQGAARVWLIHAIAVGRHGQRDARWRAGHRHPVELMVHAHVPSPSRAVTFRHRLVTECHKRSGLATRRTGGKEGV